jgi:hypothetical protein
MMAFLDLGWLLLEKGDAGNALAMSKSAILADTGTRQEKWGSDLVSGWMLQALAFRALNEPSDADRAVERAVDAIWIRSLADVLEDRLRSVPTPDADPDAVATARALLLAGLPAGLAARSRDPVEAIRAAKSWAVDARAMALDSPRKTWPVGIAGLRRGDLQKSFDAIEPMASSWIESAATLPAEVTEKIASDEAQLRRVLGARLVLLVEAGQGPRKYATGRYGEVLRIAPGTGTGAPSVALDGRPTRPALLDSVTWQAQTRGGRRVDGFLRGKAVFKDASPFLGWALIEAGAIVDSTRRGPPKQSNSDEIGLALELAGAGVWLVGALVNPEADTRQWDLLPEGLWIVPADPAPGTHALEVDGRQFTVDIPDDGRVFHVLPALSPAGAERFGAPCTRCPAPLAIPAQTPEKP